MKFTDDSQHMCEHGIDYLYFCSKCNGNVEWDKNHRYYWDDNEPWGDDDR